jgi:hypothetical protein
MDTITINLVGGPAELQDRRPVVRELPDRLRVPFLAGYEHFERTSESEPGAVGGAVAVYTWRYHTAIAE